jgi:hypothetical protein
MIDDYRSRIVAGDDGWCFLDDPEKLISVQLGGVQRNRKLRK